MAIEMKQQAAIYDEQRAENEEHVVAHHRALVVDVQAQREKPVIAKDELLRRHKTVARELRQEMEQLEAQVCFRQECICLVGPAMVAHTPWTCSAHAWWIPPQLLTFRGCAHAKLRMQNCSCKTARANLPMQHCTCMVGPAAVAHVPRMCASYRRHWPNVVRRKLGVPI